jgi:hypothetical protein
VVLVLLLETAPTPAPALVLDVALVPDVALDPKPLVFGPVGTLQKVATISSTQIRPVFGRIELFIWPPAPSACCCCAATGEAAKSNATVNASIFITDSLRWYGTRRADPRHLSRRGAPSGYPGKECPRRSGDGGIPCRRHSPPSPRDLSTPAKKGDEAERTIE